LQKNLPKSEGEGIISIALTIITLKLKAELIPQLDSGHI